MSSLDLFIDHQPPHQRVSDASLLSSIIAAYTDSSTASIKSRQPSECCGEHPAKTSSLISPDNIPHPVQRQGRQSWSADLQIPPILSEWSEDLVEQTMSGSDTLAARDRIATVCSTYQEGFDLVQQIKSKRRAKKAVRQAPQLDETTQDLEQSLVRGQGTVRAQYDRDSRRFGEPFANGDQMARDALRDLISHLRTQVIANLKLNLQQETFVDFTALQDVSDSSQDRCILILMQLQQRIVTSGPIQNLTPPPLNVPGVDDQRQLPAIPQDPYLAQSGGLIFAQREMDLSFSQPGMRPSSGPLTPPHSPSGSRSVSQVQASSGPSIQQQQQQQRPQPPQTPLASSTNSVYSQTQALQGFIDQQVSFQQGSIASAGSSLNNRSQTMQLPAEHPYPTQQNQRPPLTGSKSSFVHPNFAVHPGQPVYNPVIGAPNTQSEASASASQYSLPQSPQVQSPQIQHPPSRQQSAQYPSQQAITPCLSQQAPVIQPSSPQRQSQPQVQMPSHQRQPSAASSIPTSSHQRGSSKGSTSRFSSETRSSSSNSQYKPIATTTEKSGFLGFRRKKVEMVPEPRENPLVEQYIASAREDHYSGYSQPPSTNGSISTTRSSFYGLDQQPVYPPHHEQQREAINFPSPASSVRSQAQTSPAVQESSPFRGPIDRAKVSMDSITRATTHLSNHSNPHVEVLSSARSIHSMNPKDALPSEYNGYAGFCKGAWRQQIGDRKKAIEERVRPGGMYNSAKYLQCKQCKFEGRLVATNKKAHHGFDMRVFNLVEGIQFRWEFLFKSHVPTKEPMPDPTKAHFGCMFCCAEGKPTPMFQGVNPFMAHLVEHRDRLPHGEVLYRMNCLVGRQASTEEDFDINIIGREGVAF